MQTDGIILRCIDGRYTVRCDSGTTLTCTARGRFRHERIRPEAGDRVTITADTESGENAVISAVLPRKTELLRPPIANLGLLFIVIAAAKPMPALITVDKMISVAEYRGITPVILVTKADLAPGEADRLASDYRKCGFTVFVSRCDTADSTDALHTYLLSIPENTVTAFTGASGVGKSTLMTALFPALRLETNSLSRKTDRGRHTTRCVTLYPLEELTEGLGKGYLADTPGFSMLDLAGNDYFTRDELSATFREFTPYLSSCRYTDCSHTKENGCAVLAAVREGKIPASRHLSFLSMYRDLKDKHPWDKN